MVFDLVDKEGTKSGKGLGWSWFGLNDGKRDAKILRELGELYKGNSDYVDTFNQKIKGLTVSSRENAKEMKANSANNIEFSKGLLNAAASADKMTISTRATELGMKALRIAGNMLAGLAVGVLLNFALEQMDNYIHRQEKAAEAAANLKSEYDSLNSEVISLGNEIKTTSARIDELLGKGSLSIVEQEELTRLQLTNVELERQVKLKEMLAKETGKEAEKAAVKAYNLDDKTINVIDAFG